MTNLGVLMGDIISSQKTTSNIQLHKDFNSIVKKTNISFQEIIISPLTITLGDEFQSITKDLESSFIIANDMRLNLLLKNIDMRFSVGEVSIDKKIINKSKSWNMIGPGFAQTREILNNKKNPNSYRFNFSLNPKIEIKLIEELINFLGKTLTEIENNWTENQKNMIYEFQKKPTSIENFSKKVKKTKSTIYSTFESAKYEQYKETKQLIIKTLRHIDKRN